MPKSKLAKLTVMMANLNWPVMAFNLKSIFLKPNS